LRVGCVKYLNARPLIHGWPGEVILDYPSVLCDQLAHAQLDIALVSSFEFLRNPIYRIVDGISISSRGPVYSVIVAYRGELSDLEQIQLDPAAETSVNLLRCLLGEAKLHPRFVSGSASSVTKRCGQLLIGDQAIRFRRDHEDDVCFWDLGEQWQSLMDLPFVYALWLVRPEVTNVQPIADCLRALRDTNLDRIDDLVAGQKSFNAAFCKRYYRQHLRFSFGKNERKGLRAFQKLCEKHGLLPKREIAFNMV
jgi:chorismate dehydratase